MFFSILKKNRKTKNEQLKFGREGRGGGAQKLGFAIFANSLIMIIPLFKKLVKLRGGICFFNYILKSYSSKFQK